MDTYLFSQGVWLRLLCAALLLAPALGLCKDESVSPDTPAPAVQSPANQAQALLTLAESNIQQAQFEQALMLLTRAYRISRSLDSSGISNNVLNSMANVYYATGQYDQAHRYYGELIVLDEAAGDLVSLAVSLFNQGHVNASRAHYLEAEANFQRSLAISRELGDNAGSAYTLKALGVNAQAKQNLAAATAYLQQALQLFQKVGDTVQFAIVHRHLGDIAEQELRLEAAVSHYEFALPILAASSFNTALMRTYRGLSRAYGQLQQYEKAFISHQAFTQLLQQQLEQQSRQATQRMQVQFETRRLAADNESLELRNRSQQAELTHRQDMLRMQYLVIGLALGIILLVAWLWLRSRHHAHNMQLLAITDELTGLLNRRAIMQSGTGERRRSQRFNRSLCCLMFDIDHFKKVNDTWGHGVGDEVLKSTAAATKSTLRKTDTLGRIGGEEFLVFAPETTVEQAEVLAERIRRMVEKLVYDSMEGQAVTVSIGIVQMSDELTLEELIGHADLALYEAKGGGRNRTRVFRDKEVGSELAHSNNAAVTLEWGQEKVLPT